jgi:hypothetical protein
MVKAKQPIEEEVQTEAEEPVAPPPAVINSAQYDYDGQTVMLTITKDGETEPVPYALNQTDPYGLSPFLREELTRMIDAGDITILAAPQMPAEDE